MAEPLSRGTSGLIINGVKLMRDPKGMLWVSMPDAKRRDRHGELVFGEGQRPVWDPIMVFASRDTRDRFNAVVLEGIAARLPRNFQWRYPVSETLAAMELHLFQKRLNDINGLEEVSPPSRGPKNLI